MKHATISFDITAESLTLYLQKQIWHRAHKKCENIGFNILSKVQRTFFWRWQANNLGWGGSGKTFLLINWTCRGSFWGRQRTWCLRGWGKKRKSMLNVSGNFVTIAPFTIHHPFLRVFTNTLRFPDHYWIHFQWIKFEDWKAILNQLWDFIRSRINFLSSKRLV